MAALNVLIRQGRTHLHLLLEDFQHLARASSPVPNSAIPWIRKSLSRLTGQRINGQQVHYPTITQPHILIAVISRSSSNMTQQDNGEDRDIASEEEQPLLSHDVQTTPTDKSGGVGSSWYASVFLVVNAGLGAGLLNFPAAFDQSGGMLVAILMQAVLMVFIVGSLLILVYCSTVHHSATYQDVVYSMCGKGVQMTCAVVIVIYCFGTCITFFIIIGDQWDIFLRFAYGGDYCHYWYMNRKFTMVSTSLLFVLPLCFPKRIDFLKYARAQSTPLLFCLSDRQVVNSVFSDIINW
ncbi:putative sodium-coupled neutral amino acid transporter 7 [Lamellibrachia satsuma]|nr:putative sodium-coupled neutral amino acid transporter 7 [Lamellibrachia satsuma]